MEIKVKKALSLLFCLVFLLSFSLPCFAQGKTKEENSLPVEIKAKSAVLIDIDSGKILMQKDIDKRLYPASVTKIMTMLLVMESLDSGKIKLTDTVSASTESAGKGGSQIWLKEGERMSVEELLKATAIYSANDACTALGEHIAGTDEAFTAMLNERAQSLGMTNTHFDNCTGLDDATNTHLTTARDVATMTRELLKHKEIEKYTTVWMDTLRNGETQLVNTNKLIRFYKGATGLKTGTTSKAGCCISASARRNGLHLAAVVLGSPNSKDRFNTARKMLDWGFSNYALKKIEIDKNLITKVKVLGGEKDFVMPQLPSIDKVLIKKGQENNIKTEVKLALDVGAPVEKNQVLGKIKIRCGDEIIGTYNLTSKERVEKLTVLDIFIRLLASMA